MIFGYIRVSTKDQKTDLQEDALLKSGVKKENLFMEVASGAKSNRKELERMKSIIRKGDTVIVWKLDRIARSVIDLVKLMEFFNENEVSFKSIQDPHIDTTSAQGKFIYTVFGAVAQFERDLIRERTKAGLKAAEERGRKGGRRPGLSRSAKKKAKVAASLYSDPKNTVKEIMETLDIKSKPTLYKYLDRKSVV